MEPVQRQPSCLASVERYATTGDIGSTPTIIPGDPLIWWTVDQEGADFTGLAVLHSAYAPWKLKVTFQTIDAIPARASGRWRADARVAGRGERGRPRRGRGHSRGDAEPREGLRDLAQRLQVSWSTTDSQGTGLAGAIEIANCDIRPGGRTRPTSIPQCVRSMLPTRTRQSSSSCSTSNPRAVRRSAR